MDDINAERRKEEVKKETRKKIKDCTYVVCSTLNQMVNYIPYKIYGFKNIHNITIDKSDVSNYFENELWDDNLKSVIEQHPHEKNGQKLSATFTDLLAIPQSQMGDVDYIKAELNTKINNEENKEKTYFWNITGGQRSLLLAITDFVRENKREKDYLCYLEGNNNRLVIMQNGEQVFEETEYSVDELTIEDALALAGFDLKYGSNSNSYRNLLKSEENEASLYEKLYDIYIKDCKNKGELRKYFIKTNSDYYTKDNLTHNGESVYYSIINLVKNELTEEELELLKGHEHLKRNNAFGYILEKMTVYQLIKILLALGQKNPVNSLVHSAKIKFSDTESQSLTGSENHIDEFDIALLTKHGKIITYECKSGGMTGDVAKSTKYSTYAIAGVYGKPILITPFLRSEINSLHAILQDSSQSKNVLEKNKLFIDSGKKDKRGNPINLFDPIISAIKAASRASLDKWGIDEIEEKLTDLLNSKE